MLNKLLSYVRQHRMLNPGDHLICAVSGGADSVALLYAMHLLTAKLGITLEAAHFNHCLRGSESDADAEFVRQLCQRMQIPLYMGKEAVVAGNKGLEAAARQARYSFFEGLPGKIATAHTADDNAETVLMHLIRGTGLKGLGGIAPVRSNLIRPMLCITRAEVLAFLKLHQLPWREDSSNGEDSFLRNRLRHRVMPLLKEENPCIVQNISDMAQRLREDEALLTSHVQMVDTSVEALRGQPCSIRHRWIRAFLEAQGMPETEREHVDLVERLIFSDKPSAQANLPGGKTVARCYDQLKVLSPGAAVERQVLNIPCSVPICGTDTVLRISEAGELCNGKECFTVAAKGSIVLRGRETGDSIRLPGGRKTLKKLFTDHKIPAHDRPSVSVLSDDEGVLWVMNFGPNLDRLAMELPALEIRVEKSKMED